MENKFLKCTACGYEEGNQLDCKFYSIGITKGQHGFYIDQYNLDRTRSWSIPVYLFACPKCGTVKMIK